ncbi:uncharacterized protein KIAA0754-like [Branchiostoma floridae]|uniref:Uncharacterized protein KIAA0754-like n=1 Tax=Branchiostoma floridae TaxID=7739 RepID=A0A9J7NC83_BRAFL|nr:uncharacterized protein KIAA0754-like [Branchiostoma floridae]
MTGKCSKCRVVACQRCKPPRSRSRRKRRPPIKVRLPSKTWKVDVAILVLSIGPAVVTSSAVPVETAGASNPPDFCPTEPTYPHPFISRLQCKLCAPGQYVEHHCTSTTSSQSSCVACPPRKYQPCPSSNIRCHPCSDCGDFLVDDGRFGPPREPCSPTQDNICHCPQDKYWSLEDPGCKMTNSCGPGEGVAHQATYKSDTVCITCQDGFYSNETSHVQVCAECRRCEEEGLETLQPCSTTSDAVCSTDGSSAPPSPDPLPSSQIQDAGLEWWKIFLIALAATCLLVGIILLIIWKRRRNGAVPNNTANCAAQVNVTYNTRNGVVYTAVSQGPFNSAVPATIPANAAVPGAAVPPSANGAVLVAAVHPSANGAVPGAAHPPSSANGAVPGAAHPPSSANGAVPGAAIPPFSNAAISSCSANGAVPSTAVRPSSANGVVSGAAVPLASQNGVAIPSSSVNGAIHGAVPYPPSCVAVPPPSANGAAYAAVFDGIRSEQQKDNCNPAAQNSSAIIGQPSSAVIGQQPSSAMQCEQPESNANSWPARSASTDQPQCSAVPRQLVSIQQPSSAAGSGQPSTTITACQPSSAVYSAVPSAGPTRSQNMQQGADGSNNDSANPDSWTDPKATIQGCPVPDTHDPEGNTKDLNQKDAHDAVEELPVHNNRSRSSSRDVDAVQDSKDPPNNADDALEKEAREPVQDTELEGAAGPLQARQGPYGSSNENIPAAAVTHR